MKQIKLSNGGFAIVDDKDFEWLNKYTWHSNHRGYAIRNTSKTVNGYKKQWVVIMHREINKTPKGLDTDHINRNRLDNRRTNLRTATRSLNLTNDIRFLSLTTGIKPTNGKRGNRFAVWITCNNKSIRLGTYDTIEQAKMIVKAARRVRKQYIS